MQQIYDKHRQWSEWRKIENPDPDIESLKKNLNDACIRIADLTIENKNLKNELKKINDTYDFPIGKNQSLIKT